MPMFSVSIRDVSAALLIAAVIIGTLVFGKSILVPFALAMLLTFILQPIVSRLTRAGIPEGGASAAVVLCAVAVVVGGAVLFSSQLLSLASDLAQNRHNLAMKMRTIAGVSSASDSIFKRASDAIDAVSTDIKREMNGTGAPSPSSGPAAAPQATSQGPVVVAPSSETPSPFNFHTIEGMLSPVASAGLVLLFTMFLLMQHHDLRDRVVRVAGTDNMSVTSAALSEAASRLSDIFTMQALLNGGFGLFVAIALWALGVPNALLWGVATAMLRFVPFVGAFLAAIPPMVVAAAIDPGWTTTLLTAAVFVIGEPIMGHVIEPLVLGKRAGLSPLAFLFAASFWTLIWGPIGLILAAPLTMTLVVLGQYVPRFEFITVLLGDEPALAPEQEFYHRLLSADSYAAYEQFEDAETATGFVAASDSIVVPALQYAARDHRGARIEADQVETLRESMDEFLDIVEDNDDTVRERKDGRDDLRPIIVIAARGPIDEIGARFIAGTAKRRLLQPIILIEKDSGLMALASAKGVLGDDTASDVVIVTVGGIERNFGKLIRKRALRDYPTSRVISCELYGDAGDAGFDKDIAQDRQFRCRSVQQLLIALEASAAQAATAVESVSPARPITGAPILTEARTA